MLEGWGIIMPTKHTSVGRFILKTIMIYMTDFAAYQANIIGRMGVFRSPRFPQTIPGNLECYWGFHPVYFPQRFRMVVAFEAAYLRDSEGAPNCT